MAEDIQGLLEKIHTDGIQKAETEKAAIIASAREEAARIIAAAKAEAETYTSRPPPKTISPLRSGFLPKEKQKPDNKINVQHILCCQI